MKPLTPIERTILLLYKEAVDLGMKFKYRYVAQRGNFSEKTVDTYLHRLRHQKGLEIRSTPELIEAYKSIGELDVSNKQSQDRT